jgi:hypothetical protein
MFSRKKGGVAYNRRSDHGVVKWQLATGHGEASERGEEQSSTYTSISESPQTKDVVRHMEFPPNPADNQNNLIHSTDDLINIRT